MQEITTYYYLSALLSLAFNPCFFSSSCNYLSLDGSRIVIIDIYSRDNFKKQSLLLTSSNNEAVHDSHDMVSATQYSKGNDQWDALEQYIVSICISFYSQLLYPVYYCFDYRY